MSKRRIRFRTVYFVCCLTVCISLFLPACSKDRAVDGTYESVSDSGLESISENMPGEDNISAGNNGSHITPGREWVYVPEVIAVGDGRADYGQMQLIGDTFCYVLQGGDTEESLKSICQYSLTEGELTSVPIEWPEGGENWDVGFRSFDRDNGLYLTANVYSGDYSRMKRFLCKFDLEGNCLFARDITEQLGRDVSPDRLTVDGQGRLYIFVDNGEILLYTSDGEYHGSVRYSSPDSPVPARIKGACDGANGGYYICVSKGNVDIAGEKTEDTDLCCTLMEIDFEGVRLLETAGNLPDISGICAGKQQSGDAAGESGEGGTQYDLLLYDRRAVYGYDFAAQKSDSGAAGEELLIWMDSDINGYCVTNLYMLEDGRLCAAVEDWRNGDVAIVILEKTRAELAPQRENLVLATVDGESDLAAMAVRFNRGNSQYHLTVKNYASLTDLYNAVLTREPMDLIDLSGINARQLASQGFFEDLAPYVEQSDAFERSDFVEGIWNVYTFGDTLVSIPAAFTLRTVVGDGARTENKRGLTLEELLTAVDLYPGAQTFDGVTKEEMMQYIMLFNEDVFIDWENGICHFDSESFKAVLKYVNQFPDSLGSGEEEVSLPVKIKNGEVLFAIADMNELKAFQKFVGMFGEDAACVGFPTPDGGGGHLLFTSDAYAIAAVSEHKEGAWRFIEDFLAREKGEFYYHNPQNYFRTSFPTLKKTLNERVEDTMEADSQIPDDKFRMAIYSDGTTFQYHALTWEEVNVMLELVPNAKPFFYMENDEIMKIISEEASGYYSGQKGIDDVAGVIQNRVQVYVNENN